MTSTSINKPINLSVTRPGLPAARLGEGRRPGSGGWCGMSGISISMRVLREAAGMSLEEVAEAADISAIYLSRFEAGEVTPTVGWVSLVASSIGDHIAAKRVTA